MILSEVEAVLKERRDAAERGSGAPAGSYSVTLLTDPERVQRKIMEEAFEFCLELGRPAPDPQRTAEEAADLVFHVLAGLVTTRVPLDAVLTELQARRR